MAGESIRCPKHGIYYNPDNVDDCPKCLEGAVAAPYQTPELRPRRGSGLSVISSLFWLMLLGGVGYGGYRFSLVMGERGGEIFAEERWCIWSIAPLPWIADTVPP